MLSKLGAWVSTYAASAMNGTIERSGSPMWNDHNSTFVATLMTSLVTDTSRQSKLDEYWNEAANLGNEAYFEQSMKILCGLLVSGNMPNLSAGSLTPIEPPPAALSRPVASNSSFLFANNTVSVSLKGQSKVELLDLQGRMVRTLWNGIANGSVSMSVDAKPGLYLVRIQGKGLHETHKVAVK